MTKRIVRSSRPLKGLALAVVLLVLFALLPGSAQGQERPTGELTMYSSTIEVVVREVAAAFQQQTGLKVNYIRMSTGEAFNRIRAERTRAQASVWFVGSGDSYLAVVENG